jgi:hypothetical protein
LSGGVHHWLKSRSTREERKPVTRNDDDDDNIFYIILKFYLIQRYIPLSQWLVMDPLQIQKD